MKWTQQYHSNYVHYVHMFFACCYDTVYDVYKPNVWYITDMKWRHVFEQQNDFTSWPKLMMQCWYMCDIQVLASWASKMPRPQSENKRVLDFLLEHPRRCFTSDTSDSPVNYCCKAAASWMSMWSENSHASTFCSSSDNPSNILRPPKSCSQNGAMTGWLDLTIALFASHESFPLATLVAIFQSFHMRHMFPAVHTLWLLLVVVALNIIGTVVLLVQVRALGWARHFTWKKIGHRCARIGIAQPSRAFMQVERLATPCRLLRYHGCTWLQCGLMYWIYSSKLFAFANGSQMFLPAKSGKTAFGIWVNTLSGVDIKKI